VLADPSHTPKVEQGACHFDRGAVRLPQGKDLPISRI
jgi:hypothetical protein